MIVRLISSAAELDSLGTSWNALGELAPFHTWEWLATWWKHYGTARRQLFVAAVYDNTPVDLPRLLGVAPWYLQQTRSRGRVIRALGGGEVCTDHLGILARPQHGPPMAAAVADFLRGDEPYKAHWRAVPRLTYDYRVLPNRRLAQLRRRAGALVGWMKNGANQLGQNFHGR